MTGLACLALAAAAFVGTHLLLSHPLRAPLARAVGERPFQGIYSVVAIATFALMIWAYGRVGPEPPLWATGDAVWIVASFVMWLASILLVGSFIRNPALPGAPRPRGAPGGVFAITRHPMMWSFALWAIVHALLIATPKALILGGAIILLALGGSALQDRKKAGQFGKAWHEWRARTAFVPLSRGLAYPGTVALVGGTLLFFLATWLHPGPAGFWRWVG